MFPLLGPLVNVYPFCLLIKQNPHQVAILPDLFLLQVSPFDGNILDITDDV